jgi:1,4-dihydroxy-2-naphthoate octaprenyltransferase
MTVDEMKKFKAFFALSRPPFHTVGILPFVLGTILAHYEEAAFSWSILIWGVVGVVLIMLVTYYAGEYWDYREDALSAKGYPSKFAGGSGVIQRGILSRRIALIASIVCLVLALGVGVILQFGYGTGVWTLPMGILGLLAGFFYSARPVRWVSTGFGEVWIAFCYGWLPIAAGFYLQTGYISAVIHWMAIPVGLSIFNVILLNEFPDYKADQIAGKENMLVRLGAKKTSSVYAYMSSASWIFFVVSTYQGVPKQALLFYLPVFFVSLFLVLMVQSGRWQDRVMLERLCGINIIVNLGTTAAYIAGYAI